MPKYETEEERLEARRRSAKAYYERNKHNPEYLEKKRISQVNYCQNNRETMNEKSKEYYHRKKEYRERKIEQIKQRLINEPELRIVRNEQNKARYWMNKARMLEFEKVLLENGHIKVDFK
jgi:hypothetical protein